MISAIYTLTPAISHRGRGVVGQPPDRPFTKGGARITPLINGARSLSDNCSLEERSLFVIPRPTWRGIQNGLIILKTLVPACPGPDPGFNGTTKEPIFDDQRHCRSGKKYSLTRQFQLNLFICHPCCRFTLQFYNMDRTPAGVEIDFIIETAPKRPQSPPVVTAIEVKRGRPMLDLAAASGVKVDRLIGVYCGTRSYRFGAIEVFPVKDFVKALFAGEVF